MVYVPADLNSVDKGDEHASKSAEGTDSSGNEDATDLRQQVAALTRTLEDILGDEGDVEGTTEAIVDDMRAKRASRQTRTSASSTDLAALGELDGSGVEKLRN